MSAISIHALEKLGVFSSQNKQTNVIFSSGIPVDHPALPFANIKIYAQDYIVETDSPDKILFEKINHELTRPTRS